MAKLTIRATLTIEVTYDISEYGADDEAEACYNAKCVLGRAADHLAAQGLLSGETLLLVDEWTSKVALRA